MTTLTARAEVDAQAAQHVRDLHAGSDHALTVWAAGVLAECHALFLSADPSRYAEKRHAGYLDGYDYETDGKGVLLNRQSRGHVALIRWREIAELIAPVLQQPWFTQRRAELSKLRLELTEQKDSAFWGWITVKEVLHSSTPELQAQWADVERRCYELAAEAWQACRPGEQTSLFDL